MSKLATITTTTEEQVQHDREQKWKIQLFPFYKCVAKFTVSFNTPQSLVREFAETKIQPRNLILKEALYAG